jgi:hypothetical protein
MPNLAKGIILVFFLAFVLFATVPVMAEEVERYEASRQNDGKTIILDTQEGHVWWVQELPGGSGILYIGQVRPAKPGEWVVDLTRTLKYGQPAPSVPGQKVE